MKKLSVAMLALLATSSAFAASDIQPIAPATLVVATFQNEHALGLDRIDGAEIMISKSHPGCRLIVSTQVKPQETQLGPVSIAVVTPHLMVCEPRVYQTIKVEDALLPANAKMGETADKEISFIVKQPIDTQILR